MPRTRRKITGPYKDFLSEINRLLRQDAANQALFSSSTSARMAVQQLHMLTESIFFNGYRQYENFLRDIFLLYCQEKNTLTDKTVRSYLRPKNYLHTESMIKSAMPFLDWTSPNTIIQRAEIYLKDGYPIRLPYTSKRETIADLKKLRNHIAHKSEESLEQYKRVLRKHYTVVPLQIPEPGEFLLLPDKRNPNKYKLIVYFEFLKELAVDLTHPTN